jgi:diacylglycerol kinase family enzyme
VSNDGLFDVKLIRATSRVLYPLVFTIILTGQYAFSRHTTTLRATRVELLPETMCDVEMDGDVIPSRQRYCIQIAGHVRLLVPAPHERDGRSYGVS